VLEAAARAQLLSICGVNEAFVRVANAIVDVAREMADTAPRPRGEPYFMLDVDIAYDLRTFEGVLSHGMFRRYELALDIGCGLGGRARWLASRTGCRVVGVDSIEGLAHAANELSVHAKMSAQVSFATASPESLSFAAGTFTHAWMHELVVDEDLPTRVEQVLRVLRKGGHFMLLGELEDDVTASVLEMLRGQGAIDLEAREARLVEMAVVARRGRQRLREVLKRSWPESRLCDMLWATRRPRRAVQISGRRPS